MNNAKDLNGKIDTIITRVNELRSEMAAVNPIELQNRLGDLTIDIRNQLIKLKDYGIE